MTTVCCDISMMTGVTASPISNKTCHTASYEGYSFSVLTQVILGLIMTLTVSVSLTGNTIILIIIRRKTALRSAINLLVANMASSDILMSVVAIAFVFSGFVTNSGTIHTIIRVFLSCLQNALLCVVTVNLLTISADRFLIIVHGKDKLCPKLTKRIIYITWTLSLLLSSPPLFSVISTNILTGRQISSVHCNRSFSDNVYSMVYICLLFFLPSLIIFCLHASILRTVRQSSKQVHNYPGSTLSVSVTEYSSKLGLPTVARTRTLPGDFHPKRRAFGTILLLYIILISCWSPYMLTVAIKSINDMGKGGHKASVILLCFGCLKCALFPVIYCARNKKFRDACSSVLPDYFKCPERMKKSSQRRVNPSLAYECTEMRNKT